MENNNNNIFLGKLEKSGCYLNNGKYGYFITTAHDNKIFGSNCVVPLIIVLFNKVVTPETFNEEPHVILLFNVVVPDTYNELYVALFCSVVVPDINNDPLICVLPLF